MCFSMPFEYNRSIYIYLINFSRCKYKLNCNLSWLKCDVIKLKATFYRYDFQINTRFRFQLIIIVCN